MVNLYHCIQLCVPLLLNHKSLNTEGQEKEISDWCHKCVFEALQKNWIKWLTDLNRILTLPQAPVIHEGHGLMLQPSFTAGLIFRSHPRLRCPSVDLQSTWRFLMPSPQETEHWRKQNNIDQLLFLSTPLKIWKCIHFAVWLSLIKLRCSNSKDTFYSVFYF